MDDMLLNILLLIVTVSVGLLTRQALHYLKEKEYLKQLEHNKELVRIAVEFVEQTYDRFHGAEKFERAKLEAIRMLNEKNIKITESQVDALIEAAVKEMNDVIKQETAVRTVEDTKEDK